MQATDSRSLLLLARDDEVEDVSDEGDQADEHHKAEDDVGHWQELRGVSRVVLAGKDRSDLLVGRKRDMSAVEREQRQQVEHAEEQVHHDHEEQDEPSVLKR